MKGSGLQFDKIGYWSELKLEIIEKYGAAYTKTFKNFPQLKKFYIDGFAGAGIHLSRDTGKKVAGSPARALSVTPPFDGFFLVDLNPAKVEFLRSSIGNRRDVHIYKGDCNRILKATVFPQVRRDEYKRAVCLLDPYGLQLDWEVMQGAGQTKAIDLFLNFPVMDMNRNAIWRDPDKVSKSGLDRMNRFWGDDSWKAVAYAPDRQQDFFGHERSVKNPNEVVVAAFCQRLKDVGGFPYVSEALPMRNGRNAAVYYLILASQNPVARKIIQDIFKKYP